MAESLVMSATIGTSQAEKGFKECLSKLRREWGDFESNMSRMSGGRMKTGFGFFDQMLDRFEAMKDLNDQFRRLTAQQPQAQNEQPESAATSAPAARHNYEQSPSSSRQNDDSTSNKAPQNTSQASSGIIDYDRFRRGFAKVKSEYSRWLSMTTRSEEFRKIQCDDKLPNTSIHKNLGRSLMKCGQSVKGFTGAASQHIGGLSKAFSGMAQSGAKGMIGFKLAAVAVVAEIVLMVKICKNLTDAFKQLELNRFHMSRAFLSGGRLGSTENIEKYKTMVSKLSRDGTYSQEDITAGMSSARLAGGNLNEKTFDKIMKMSKDVAASLGTNFEGAAERLARTCSKMTVSAEDFSEVGVQVSYQQLALINSYNAITQKAERDAAILEAINVVHHGAAKEYADTLEGQYSKLKNTWAKTKATLGEVFTPAMKGMIWLAQKLLELVNAVTDRIKQFQEEATKKATDPKWLAKTAFSFTPIGRMLKLYNILTGNTHTNSADTDTNNPPGDIGENNNYIDPNASMSVNFESGLSMNQRIQQSIMEKNGPQAQQLDLLGKINGVLEKIRAATESTTEGVLGVRSSVDDLELGVSGGRA